MACHSLLKEVVLGIGSKKFSPLWVLGLRKYLIILSRAPVASIFTGSSFSKNNTSLSAIVNKWLIYREEDKSHTNYQEVSILTRLSFAPHRNLHSNKFSAATPTDLGQNLENKPRHQKTPVSTSVVKPSASHIRTWLLPTQERLNHLQERRKLRIQYS